MLQTAMNILSLLNFTLENLALIFSAFLFVKFLSKNQISSLGKLILSTLTLYISAILLIEILLGTFSALTQFNISIFSYTIAIITILVFRKNLFLHTKIEKKNKLPLFALLAIFTPISLLLFIRFFNNLLQIPMEYDSVYYHLPFMVNWLQSGSLTTPFYTAFSGPIGYYPGNYELLDLWFTSPFKNDIFINLLNFPVFALLGFTTYKISRNFDISRKISLISTAMIFYMPVFLKQIGTPLVDLFFALSFTLSIYFLQEIYKNKEKKFDQTLNILCFGLALGIFIGTKYLGLAYAIIPILILLTFCRKIRLLSLALLGIFLSGSFFYFRNLIITGNPLFPVDIKLLGLSIFNGYPGINDYISHSALLGNLNSFAALKKFAGILYHQAGLQFFIMGLAIIGNLIFISYQSFVKKTKNLARAWALNLGTIACFIVYLSAPYTFSLQIENVRFALPFFVLACVNVGYFLKNFPKLKNFFYLLIFVIISYSLSHLISFHPPDIALTKDYKIYIILLGISFATLIFALIPRNFKNKKIAIATSLISILASFLIFWQIANFAIPERNKLLTYFNDVIYGTDPRVVNLIKAADWFNQNAPEAKIAYTSFNFHYHFYGPKLNRAVDYININACGNCDYFDFKNEKDGIRSNPNYESWLKNLQAKQKEYLVIDTKFTAGVQQYELDWANSHTEKFQKVWQKDNTFIYKIISI